VSTRTASVSNAELLAAIRQLEASFDRNHAELLDLVRSHQEATNAQLDQYYHKHQTIQRTAEMFRETIMRFQGFEEDVKELKTEVQRHRRVLTPEQAAAFNAIVADELDSINEVGR
jgi:thioesterase domain-containing protein